MRAVSVRILGGLLMSPYYVTIDRGNVQNRMPSKLHHWLERERIITNFGEASRTSSHIALCSY